MFCCHGVDSWKGHCLILAPPISTPTLMPPKRFGPADWLIVVVVFSFPEVLQCVVGEELVPKKLLLYPSLPQV